MMVGFIPTMVVGEAGLWKAAECTSSTMSASTKENSKRESRTAKALPFIQQANPTQDRGRKVSRLLLYMFIGFIIWKSCLLPEYIIEKGDCTVRGSLSLVVVRCTKGPSSSGGGVGQESSPCPVDSHTVLIRFPCV